MSSRLSERIQNILDQNIKNTKLLENISNSEISLASMEVISDLKSIETDITTSKNNLDAYMENILFCRNKLYTNLFMAMTGYCISKRIEGALNDVNKLEIPLNAISEDGELYNLLYTTSEYLANLETNSNVLSSANKRVIFNRISENMSSVYNITADLKEELDINSITTLASSNEEKKTLNIAIEDYAEYDDTVSEIDIQITVANTKNIYLENGSESAPYIIFTKEDFINKFINNDGSDVHYFLKNDITITEDDMKDYLVGFKGMKEEDITNKDIELYTIGKILESNGRTITLEDFNKLYLQGTFGNIKFNIGMTDVEYNRATLETIYNSDNQRDRDRRLTVITGGKVEYTKDSNHERNKYSFIVNNYVYDIKIRNTRENKVDIMVTPNMTAGNNTILFDGSLLKYNVEGTDSGTLYFKDDAEKCFIKLTRASTSATPYTIEIIYLNYTSEPDADGQTTDYSISTDSSTGSVSYIKDISIFNLALDSSLILMLDNLYNTYIQNRSQIISSVEAASRVSSALLECLAFIIGDARGEYENTRLSKYNLISNYIEMYRKVLSKLQTEDGNFNNDYAENLYLIFETLNASIQSVMIEMEGFDKESAYKDINDTGMALITEAENLINILSQYILLLDKKVEDYISLHNVGNKYSDILMNSTIIFSRAIASELSNIIQLSTTPSYSDWAENILVNIEDTTDNLIRLYVGYVLGERLLYISSNPVATPLVCTREMVNKSIEYQLRRKLVPAKTSTEDVRVSYTNDSIDDEDYLLLKSKVVVAEAAGREQLPGNILLINENLFEEISYTDCSYILEKYITQSGTLKFIDTDICGSVFTSVLIRYLFEDNQPKNILHRVELLDRNLKRAQRNFKALLLEYYFRKIVDRMISINGNNILLDYKSTLKQFNGFETTYSELEKYVRVWRFKFYFMYSNMEELLDKLITENGNKYKENLLNNR